MHEPGSTLHAAVIGGAAEAMHYRHNWPTRGRPPAYVAYGEPMRASRLRTFKTHCQEVGGLIDYAITYRTDLA
jgi:1-acyl-sn-glycerol-3-phosphate acyltransferase